MAAWRQARRASGGGAAGQRLALALPRARGRGHTGCGARARHRSVAHERRVSLSRLVYQRRRGDYDVHGREENSRELGVLARDRRNLALYLRAALAVSVRRAIRRLPRARGRRLPPLAARLASAGGARELMVGSSDDAVRASLGRVLGADV